MAYIDDKIIQDQKPTRTLMPYSCPYCTGHCDCTPPSDMEGPVVTSSEKSSNKKIVLNILFRGEEMEFEIEPVSWMIFFRKFRLRFRNLEWLIDYNRKNKVRGHDKYHPMMKMTVLENVHFPNPHSLYSINFGWWLPRIEGGPRQKGRFAFFELYHNNVPLHTTQIGIYHD